MPNGIDNMGVMNTPWGICGFTSSLYALYTHSIAKKQKQLAKGGASPTQVLAEIKGYLRTLQADGCQDILDSIQTFTQSFAGFDAWTIATYIEKVNSVVAHGANQSDPQFGIGMPPDAVIDYMKRICNFQNPHTVDVGANVPEAILGMGTDKLGMPLYNGLGHYLYYLNGTIYSWGQQFANPTVAMDGVGGVPGKDWRIVYKIVP